MSFIQKPLFFFWSILVNSSMVGKEENSSGVLTYMVIIMMAKEYAAKGLIWPLFSTAVFFLIFVGALTLLFDRLEKRLAYFR